MTFDEFTIQLDRLKSVYGEKPYVGERSKIIWDFMKEVPVDSLHRAITQHIGESDKAPLIPFFREISWRFQGEFSREQMAEMIRQGRACKYCANTGVMGALNHDDLSLCAFQCTHCPSAQVNGLSRPLKDPDSQKYESRVKWSTDVATRFTAWIATESRMSVEERIKNRFKGKEAG